MTSSRREAILIHLLACKNKYLTFWGPWQNQSRDGVIGKKVGTTLIYFLSFLIISSLEASLRVTLKLCLKLKWLNFVSPRDNTFRSTFHSSFRFGILQRRRHDPKGDFFLTDVRTVVYFGTNNGGENERNFPACTLAYTYRHINVSW